MSVDASTVLKSLVIFLWVGEEDFMASSQLLERTSSSTPFFFLGMVSNRVEENAAPGGEYGNKLERMPNLDLFTGGGSVRTGAEWLDFRSIGSRLVTQYIKRKWSSRYLTAEQPKYCKLTSCNINPYSLVILFNQPSCL